MMTAPRQVDGVAKILTKNDTERLKNPAVKPKLLQAEFLSCAYVFYQGVLCGGVLLLVSNHTSATSQDHLGRLLAAFGWFACQ